MPIHVAATAHGAAALDALAAAVRAAKGGDPLAPVAIVVPTNTVGVMARRALGRRGGACAVEVLTTFRVAELLGAPALRAEGRRPVSTPVVDLAVKQVLAERPGCYESVQRHPSTVVALRDLYRELRVAGPGAVQALARTRRGAEPARVVAAVAARLATEWYDEGDLLVRAAQRAGADLPSRFARVVAYLPERVRPLERSLLQAIADRASVELLVGLTVDVSADASTHRLVAELGAVMPPPASAPASAVVQAVQVISTTDADDEVRLGVRELLRGARSGIPFDRMAIVWPTDRPYARMVEHQLQAACIPWNGRPGKKTAERMAPRVLADLLELDRRGLRRSNLTTLLGDVPARDRQGRPVPTSRWERIGRRAGIVREADWDRRLALARADAVTRHRHDVDEIDSLRAFVDELREALGDPGRRCRWSEWVTWSNGQLERWFGRSGLDRLEGDERVAWEQTQRVLDRLAHLDSIGDPVTRADFRATFVAELEVTPARHGKVGDGVHLGALHGAVGLDVDLVVVLGAADGLLPPPPALDPLLGEADRAAAGLVGTAERVELTHRHFLALTATTAEVLVTEPRGDLRAAAHHHPSRWLAAVTVARRSMDSHAHALAVARFPVSAAEHRTRELWASVRAGADIRRHRLATSDGVLQRAIRLRDARASDRLTEYDGDLSSHARSDLATLFARPVTPTQIELWANCPHAYFVRYLLGVRPIEEPEAIETLTPGDRGQALHEAIDRLQQEVLAGRLRDPAPHGWDDEHRRALARIAERVTDELQAAGRSGRPASWANDRTAILAELDAWMTHDAAAWAGRSIRSSEAAFGDDEPVLINLPDGRAISFHGRVDRIDRLPDGRLVVTDHKTGKADKFKQLCADDPTVGASMFQLPVYAAAARVLEGQPDAAVEAEYAFFDREEYLRVRMLFDQDTERCVAEALALVVDGIESGFFPLRPEPPAWRRWVACEFCEPDGLGTATRWEQWERKRHDPRLARWFADPDDPHDPCDGAVDVGRAAS